MRVFSSRIALLLFVPLADYRRVRYSSFVDAFVLMCILSFSRYYFIKIYFWDVNFGGIETFVASSFSSLPLLLLFYKIKFLYLTLTLTAAAATAAKSDAFAAFFPQESKLKRV